MTFDSENPMTVDQLVEISQLKAIAYAMVYAQENYFTAQQPLSLNLNLLMAEIEKKGFDILTHYPEPDLAYFRAIDLAMVINRLRTLQSK